MNVVSGVVTVVEDSKDGYGSKTTYSLGFMGGFLGKNWGGYTKLLWVPDYEAAVPTVTIGATKRVFSFMHAYAGVGYGKVNLDDEYYDESWSEDAMAFDLGAIFRVKNHISANVGISCVTNFDNTNFYFSAGVGYVF